MFQIWITKATRWPMSLAARSCSRSARMSRSAARYLRLHAATYRMRGRTRRGNRPRACFWILRPARPDSVGGETAAGPGPRRRRNEDVAAELRQAHGSADRRTIAARNPCSVHVPATERETVSASPTCCPASSRVQSSTNSAPMYSRSQPNDMALQPCAKNEGPRLTGRAFSASYIKGEHRREYGI